ncbi:MAG: DUF5312 domain-containing protein, partial [Treponema sp.]|nr:DUF5312 domain-containing protein [Treponema sp.]
MSDSHFHRESRGLKELASQLSQEERSGILEKLKKQKKMSTEPLYVHDLVIDREHLDSHEKQYSRLPGLSRFFYFLAGLFKGMPASKAFDEKKFDRLGKKVQSSASKYFNYDKRLLLSGFYELTGKLKDSVRFFYAAMNTGVTRDKGDFYAFMGSLELADVHAMLETFTSAEVVLEKRPGIKESELHSIMTKGMEDALKKIPEQKKNIMYNNARALYCFKELSSFQFDHLLLAFDSTISGRTCQVGHVRGMLTTLNNIFFSLGEPPSMSLMQSLINFMIQEKAGSKGYDIDGEMKALFASAEEAIGAIREFNKKIPLTQILRCVCRDMDLSPQQISGGEDWFFVYRDHWKHQLESSYAEYNRKHKD